ncbi:trypsin-like peptidase domain-containing protein [Streptomyces cyslabdanicus]|uniref:trypsin-like peptidase domain-containing protein n=1 Tax=Streptomyces cyslabdanicus TaxID=1470456 RepID=UPI004043A0E0
MNEGKPTKSARPRWWSRSVPVDERPEGTPGADPAEGAASGGSVGAEPQAAVPARADADGDYELDRPRQASGAAPDTGDFELAQPLRAPAEPEDTTDPAAGDSDAGVGDDRPVDATVGRPRPLHDPDPYSTPPYGEPGPWAPAPPVQHPAVTPAHGTPTFPSGSPAPATAPAGAPQGTPAADDQPPYGAAPPAAPPGAPASSQPAPSGPPSPPQARAAAPQGAPPADARPAGVPHGVPSADVRPAGVPQGAPGAGDPAYGSPAPALAPGAGAASADPWGRYDPWGAGRAAAPLQQTGAGVLSVEQRHRRVTRALVGGAVVLALVSGALGGLAGAYIERDGGLGAVELPQAGKEPAGRAPDSVAGIAARALPSVVTLHVSGSGEQGTGTGFVLDDRGHVLTNNHVVENAASGGEISVTFSGGQTAKARIVGRDTGYDLAVVQVRGVRGLTPIPLGNSDNVQVGDPVVAIGAPFDLANTVTSGIISAKERPITAGGEKGDGSDVSYVDALQTDAPINPGNSGGPLLDARGRVVGINSAIRSADTGSDPQTGQAGSIGLGFAIPVNQARRVAEELINHGKASHPVIGVTLDMNYAGDGARVGAKGADGGPPVTPGGPGAKAGITAGDVITAVDGQRVHSGEELIVKTRAHRPGDRLELTVERDGRARKVSLVLGSSNSN